MRATVSLMLSHGVGEPIMAHPDYNQTALHHGCLLILLRGVGPSKPRTLQKIFDKVRRVANIKITDSSGKTRDIWTRFIYDHPVENNDWGDFQTHRRLLGLITIGKFENQTELNELCRQHESLKVRYSSTLYDSRAIFFGPEANASTGSTTSSINNTNHINHDTTITTKSNDNNDSTAVIPNDVVVLSPVKRLQDEYTTPTNFKAQAFFYRENDSCSDLEANIIEFVNSLFWVLESKRLERSREKVEKINLLCAPFEQRDFVGLDMESRNNRKRCVGRVMKNLADLSLQAGLVEDALSLYHSASETLRSVNDSLWLGAAEEGLCATSSILLYPHLRDAEVLHRNASLPEGYPAPFSNTPEKWRASDPIKRVNTESKIAHENQSTPATGSLPQMPPLGLPTSSSSCSSMSSILTNSSASPISTPTSTSSSTSTISAANQSQRDNDLPGNILKSDEIPNTFRKAIINYSKYRHAAIIETEAALKAARICIEQNRPLDVAMFLQNILYITLSMSEPERVKRFEVITALYQQIGYRRKAAFFQRLAALKHVQQGNNSPDWSQTYRLMLESFDGYLLHLDPLEVIENAAGWPSLQIDLLQSLITSARRLGLSALATRHMTFLLQTQWNNMSSTEQSEMAVQLQNLSAQCEGSPVPLVLENGTVIPPANLTDLPYCIDFVAKDLANSLRPQRIKAIKAESGPFLFTPIHFSSIDRREKKKDKNKIGFFWVQNNLSEVTVRLRNPLPFELIVTDMRLLTNGIVFESLPQTIKLQPNVATVVTLQGTPIEVGELEIQGFSTHTLGVKSNCRLKHMRGRNFSPEYLVDVIPELPLITATTSLPKTNTFSNLSSPDIIIASAALSIYNGESSFCMITITNESTLPVEYLEVFINSNVEMETQKKMFQVDQDEIQSKLPIQPACSIEFKVIIFGVADFICPAVSQHAASVHSGSTGATLHHDYGSVIGGGTHSLQYSTISSTEQQPNFPSRVGSPNQQLHNNNNRRNDPANTSFRSNTSGATTATGGGYSSAGLSLPHLNATHDSNHPYAQCIEAQFKIKYSGGKALEDGYCRQCAIVFNLELLPSVQFTSWDVLPAEVPSQFYLVLDVANLTSQEMSLNYTNNKSILIEAKETCRVPIPVDRCSLEQVCASREAEYMENMGKELCFRTQMLSFSDSISKLCSEHIAENVKIHWLLTGGAEIEGIASLRGIVLTAAMIDLTTVSPLQWSIFFQDTAIQPQSEIVCTAGQSSILSVTICNQSPQPLKNLIITIKFYQDYLNGVENYNLETRVSISGPSRITIPVLKKDDKIHHECSVIFFTPGRFKSSIQCQTKPPQSLTRSCPPATEISKTQNNTNGMTQLFNDISSVTSYHEQQEHIWKFIPSIEVTVVEQ